MHTASPDILANASWTSSNLAQMVTRTQRRRLKVTVSLHFKQTSDKIKWFGEDVIRSKRSTSLWLFWRSVNASAQEQLVGSLWSDPELVYSHIWCTSWNCADCFDPQTSWRRVWIVQVSGFLARLWQHQFVFSCWTNALIQLHDAWRKLRVCFICSAGCHVSKNILKGLLKCI